MIILISNELKFISSGYLYTESGLWEYFFVLLEAKSMPAVKRENRVYQSLEEFQDAFTTFSDLSVENFKRIFLIYFSSCVLWFSVFIWKTSANLARRAIRKTVRAVRRLLGRFAIVCALFLNSVKSFFRKLFRLSTEFIRRII